jgi:hypothetical protein
MNDKKVGQPTTLPPFLFLIPELPFCLLRNMKTCGSTMHVGDLAAVVLLKQGRFR